MIQTDKSNCCLRSYACAQNELACQVWLSKYAYRQGYTPIGECGRYKYDNRIVPNLMASFREEAEVSGYRFRFHRRCQQFRKGDLLHADEGQDDF
jgi:hypothetical protein